MKKKSNIRLFVNVVTLIIFSSLILACIPIKQQAEEACAKKGGVDLIFTNTGKTIAVCNNTQLIRLNTINY